MVGFAKIEKAAVKRIGAKELQDRFKHRIQPIKSAAALRKVPDDRYLSLIGLRIFRAGLKHDMVDAKWPAFERAFHGFDPHRVRAMSDEAIEALMKDARLIRHLGKLQALHANGAAVVALAEEKGVSAPISPTGRPKTSSVCGTISPSVSPILAAAPGRNSCAWRARTRSCSATGW